MIKNYFKIAWRTLLRYKAYTAINVFGLTLSITAAILIFTLVNYQLSFDTFHPDKDRIYRIVPDPVCSSSACLAAFLSRGSPSAIAPCRPQ